MNDRNADKLASMLLESFWEALRERRAMVPEDFSLHEALQYNRSFGLQRGSTGSIERALGEVLREVVIDKLALEPCHVTGMHTPNHHIEHRGHGGKLSQGYICELQRTRALENFLASLAEHVSTDDEPNSADLPRVLHGPECGWCHTASTQEEYRQGQRASHVWAGEPIPAAIAKKGTTP